MIDTGLEIGTKVFELTGAGASATKFGLDRFWRNLRTHTLSTTRWPTNAAKSVLTRC